MQDRTIYEDAHIFAPNLHEMGLMSKRDFDNYFHFFQTLKTLVQPPDLLIYLNASVPTLVGQIQKRGREYEENIRLDYLKRLNEYYNKWIADYKEGQFRKEVGWSMITAFILSIMFTLDATWF